MVAIAAIRTSMLLPLCSVLALMVLVLKPQRESPRIQRIILVIAAAAALIVGPIITEYLGGDIFHITNVLKTVTSVGFRDTCNLFFRSENSIGSLLRPDGPLQAILFLPIRMILYLVAPLPMVFVSLRDLIDGNWGAWQHLFTVLASVINVLVFPYALASLVQAIKTKKVSAAPLVFHISYWVTFMSIAGGNFIIHERYRTMVTLLLWVCAWLGANTCSKQLIIKSSKSWYGLLCCGALVYFGFKM
ncbi:MAG: hypothetical protein H8D23_37840 [Candidatus Brocadiales bacterium]|nr:hypothetical protein [Candidatus Brocadiales bacterium]